MIDEEARNKIETLRLLLIAQLTIWSGRIWEVSVEVDNWSFIFRCKSGFHEVLRVDSCTYGWEHIGGLLKNNMVSASENLLHHHYRRMRAHIDYTNKNGT